MRASRLLLARTCSAVAIAIVTADATTVHAQGTDFSPFVIPGEAPSATPPPPPPAPAVRPSERTGPVAPDFGSEEPLEPHVDDRRTRLAVPIEMPPEVVLEAPPPSFGSQGEFVVTAASDLDIGATSYSVSEASSFGFTIAPGFDYFIVENFSIGLSGSFAYGESKGYDAAGNLLRRRASTITGGPRIGFNLPLGSRVSWYPRVTLGVESVHYRDTVAKENENAAETSNALGIPTSTKTGPTLFVVAPILFHPTPHLFFGIGPYLFTEFANAQGGPEIGGQRTSIGANLEIGTWWGGTPQAVAPEEIRPRPRFGERKQFVVTGGFGASGGKTDYVGTEASATSFSFSPGFDYFVVPHLALGLTGGVTTSTSTTMTPQGRTQTTDHTSFSMGPRIAVDIPFSPWFSLYPRSSLTIGQDDFDAVRDTARNKYSVSLVSVSLYVPLLFHFASHAFVGFGPEVSHNLVAAQDFGPQNRATHVGASFTVGGWL